MTLKAIPRLTPLQIQQKQQQVCREARHWLDPEQLAALLLYRSYDDLQRATVESFNAAYELRTARATLENLDDAARAAEVEADAAKAFAVLVEGFGTEIVCKLANKLDMDGGDDGGGEPIATKRAA